jgi:outer membrane protein OmpA-like peptidoglycan-associated protein
MRWSKVSALLLTVVAASAVWAQGVVAPEAPPAVPAAKASAPGALPDGLISDVPEPGAPAPAASPAPAALPATLVPPPPVAQPEPKPVNRADRVPPNLRASSAAGPNGLDRVWSADPGAQGTFRLRLALDWFDTTDFPLEGEDNQFVGTTFALAWTPIQHLEVFGSVRSTSNTNTGSTPSLLQTQGDVTLGVKGGVFVSDSLAVGGSGMVHLLGGPGRGGVVGDATSAELRALFTADLMRARNVPFRFHLDVSYYFENGEAVFDDLPGEPDIVQEWGLQVGRYDRLMLGFGFEAPIAPWVSPYLEYRIGTPFLVELDRRGRGSREFQFGSVPHTITPGVRGFVLPNVAIDAALRVGLSDQPYTGVQQTPPWMLSLGLTYTLDPRPEVIERTVEAKTPPPAPVQVAARTPLVGKVLAADTGAAPEDARVIYVGRAELAAQVVNRDGTFGGYRFEPGPVQVRAEATGYKPATAEAVIAQGRATSVAITLQPDPASREATLELRVFDDNGSAIAASVTVGAPANATGEIYSNKPFRMSLKPGTYPLLIEAEGFKPDERKITFTGGKTETLRVSLKPGKGKRRKKAKRDPVFSGGGGGGGSDAYLKGKRIRLARKIEFVDNGTKLTRRSKQVLRAVADVLKQHRKIKRLRIGVHTDARGDAAAKKRLSSKQAATVKTFLVKRGVKASRLQAKGYGGSRPIAPNLSAKGRKKNRRVVLKVMGK